MKDSMPLRTVDHTQAAPTSPGGNGRSVPPRRGGRFRPGAPLAVLLAISALLGGGVSAGVLLATGAVGDSSHTTTVVQSAGSGTTATQGNAGGLNPQALYASASAGVVDITSKGVSSGQQSSPFGGPPQSGTATGTGFVIDSAGNVVTAAHVVDGASSITVTFQDGSTKKATLVSKDDATDVALLKIDASGMTLHPLKLGSSSGLGVGDQVAAIGDPFGYDRSISTGIVSGLDRTVDAPNGFTVAHAIQTDAALNPGNSGGPLLNPSGQVVGIVDQIATNGNSDQNSGVGFAVPIDLVKSELSKLKSGATVSHAYLGVATSGSTTSTPGATLAQVTPGGPAARAGLRTGDIVTNIGGAKIQNANDLVAAIASHQPGDKVAITVKRGSNTVHVTATLGKQPAQSSTTG
jgi:putative serine protease PepD